jgi:glycerophosphoryl diester phosphodiesterase
MPENTMASFMAALGLGATGLETDVQMTKDGELVLIHDETVDRTTNGSGLVAGHTLSQLRALRRRRLVPRAVRRGEDSAPVGISRVRRRQGHPHRHRD